MCDEGEIFELPVGLEEWKLQVIDFLVTLFLAASWETLVTFEGRIHQQDC